MIGWGHMRRSEAELLVDAHHDELMADAVTREQAAREGASQ